MIYILHFNYFRKLTKNFKTLDLQILLLLLLRVLITRVQQFLGNVHYKNLNANIFRSSHQRCSIKTGVLKNIAKFTAKHICQSLFFNKIASNFIWKKTLAHVFSCEFCKIFKNTCFTEHLRTTTSAYFIWD